MEKLRGILFLIYVKFLKFLSPSAPAQQMSPGTKRCPMHGAPSLSWLMQCRNRTERENTHGTVQGLSPSQYRIMPTAVLPQHVAQPGQSIRQWLSHPSPNQKVFTELFTELVTSLSLPLCAHLLHSVLEHKELFPACLDFCSAWCVPASRTDGTMGQVKNHGSQMKGKNVREKSVHTHTQILTVSAWHKNIQCRNVLGFTY